MRCVVVCTAVIWAALSVCGSVSAFAQGTSGEPEQTEEAEASPEAQPVPQPDTSGNSAAVAHLLFFSGGDIWHNGAFAHGGFLYAYQGLNQDGLVFKLLLHGGFYRFRSGGSDIVGEQVMGAALTGWRWSRPGLELTVFAGVDVQNHRYTPDDPGNRLRGTHVGIRGGFDLWYEPFRDWMVTGSASLSTAGNSYWTRAALGGRFFQAVWFGPEFLAMGDDSYRQLRFGAHITSLRAFGTEWSAGAGWATDTDRRDGVYGRIGVLVRK